MSVRLSVAAAGTLVLLAPVAPAAATPAESCARTPLSLPAGVSAGYVDGVDPTGRYLVGTSYAPDEPSRLLLWRDGAVSDLGSADGSVSDVNARGDVVGTRRAAGDQFHAWRLRAGQSVALPEPAGSVTSRVGAINARGEVAGVAANADSWDNYAVVWSASGAVRQLTRPVGFNEAQASAIDDDGTVVGTVSDWDIPNAVLRDQRAVAWFPDGTWRFLPGTADGAFTSAVAVRHGVVLGSQGRTALTWQARSGPASTVAAAAPYDLNTVGSIALRPAGGADLQLYSPDRAPRTLPQTDPVMGTASVAGVDDDDQVYGTDTADSVPHPVHWTCT